VPHYYKVNLVSRFTKKNMTFLTRQRFWWLHLTCEPRIHFLHSRLDLQLSHSYKKSIWSRIFNQPSFHPWMVIFLQLQSGVVKTNLSHLSSLILTSLQEDLGTFWADEWMDCQLKKTSRVHKSISTSSCCFKSRKAPSRH